MACRNHPQIEEGLDHCYRCGFRFCDECRVEFQGHPHCAPCKSEAVSMLEAGSSSDASAGREGQLPPWERRAELGMTTAFLETVKQVISSPTRFFENLRIGVTTWDCLAIPCVVTTVGMIASAVVQIALMGTMMGVVTSQQGGDSGGAAAAFGGQIIGACCWIPLAPVFAIMASFMGAGMIHVFLMMTGKVTEPFQQTLRGYCYAQSPGVLAVIPILGSLVGGVIGLWASVVMVKTTHKTSWGIAWMAVLWFAILILGLVCIGGLLLAGVIGASSAGG